MDYIRSELTNWIELADESWVRKIKPNLPPGTVKEDFSCGGKLNPEGNFHNALAVIATTEGGSLIITCDETDDGSETKDYVLDDNAIVNGLQVMASFHPRHFKDFVNQDGDVLTDSVFVQCCLFREVVFS